MIKSEARKTHIENKIPVAREGLPFIFAGLIIMMLLFFLGVLTVAILFGLMTFFTIWFFRDPERESDAREDAVLSPADGRIIDIRHLEDPNNYLGSPALKISIFMSIFNVHVNRIPANGRISRIIYTPGRFFSANMDKASEQNENNNITLDTGNGHKIIFIQIAGFIARRIACWIKEGEDVNAGQRFGLIRFGSRLDVYLPIEAHINILPGEGVKAGKTVIGYLP